MLNRLDNIQCSVCTYNGQTNKYTITNEFKNEKKMKISSNNLKNDYLQIVHESNYYQMILSTQVCQNKYYGTCDIENKHCIETRVKKLKLTDIYIETSEDLD